MPAINPARLKKDAAELVTFFDSPDAFLRELDHLLDFYADRTLRPGQTGAPPPLLPTNNVPQPVLRRIILEITPLVEVEKQAALVLVNRLWEIPSFEHRLLAIQVLGQVEPSPPEPILEIFTSWINPGEEERLLDMIFNRGWNKLRAQFPEIIISTISEWINQINPDRQVVGLKALTATVNDHYFENVPHAFTLLAPFVRESNAETRNYLAEVLRALARRSPQETVFFLKQALVTTENPQTAWLVRKTLEALPEAAGMKLKSALKEIRR